jgi:AcrR family transcriptional regulator
MEHDMTLRERQSDLTKSAILDAAVDLFLSEGELDLTMQRVADEAGVSLRTVYRYFDNRQKLINAMGRRIDARMTEQSGRDKDLPGDFDDFLSQSHVSVGHGVANREMVRRALLFSIPHGEWYTMRDEHLWGLFREAFPHLAENDARADFGVLRHVLASTSVILIGERFGIEPDQLSDAMQRAGQALYAAIAARDRAAAAEEGKTT